MNMEEFTEFSDPMDSETMPGIIEDTIDEEEIDVHQEESEDFVTESDIIETVDSSALETFDTAEVEVLKRPKDSSKSDPNRLTKLPFSRIKSIMKMDPDVNLINSEAIFLVTKATELFLETIAKETYSYMATKKKKTLGKKDLDYVVNVVDCLCFLDGAMEF